MLQETWHRGLFPYGNGYEMRECVWYGREMRFRPYHLVSWNGNVGGTAGNAFHGRTAHVSKNSCVFFLFFFVHKTTVSPRHAWSPLMAVHTWIQHYSGWKRYRSKQISVINHLPHFKTPKTSWTEFYWAITLI